MPPTLNVAFFGSSLVSAYWNGAATYYRGIIRALHERGHRVTFYEPDAYERQQHRDIPDPEWAKVVVYSAEGTDGVHRCLDSARNADLIVKASGVGVFDELLEREVLQLKTAGNLIAFWDVDAPATLDRVQKNPDDPFLALIPRYDLVLTYGGGDPVVRAYEKLGARRCVPIYNALDPSTHHPVLAEGRFKADLGFVGNRLPDREARVEQFFLHAAQRLPERRFLLAGSGWQDKPLPPNVRHVGHLYTADHNAFNCTPLAVLNISRESMARYGFSPATRVFEAAGAGACLITDAWEGIEHFLEPGREVLVAANGDEVAAHVQRLTIARATSIGQAALRRIRSQHTYAHRTLFLEQVLDATSAPRLAPAPPAPAAPPAPPAPAAAPALITSAPPAASGKAAPSAPDGWKIVILGLSITSSWGNGHATTFRSLVRELAKRGHDVLFLERDQPWYAENRDMPDPPFGRTCIYNSLDDLKKRFGKRIRNADLVIVGSYVPEGLAIGQWVTRLARGVTAFYDIDTPVTLANLERGACDYLCPELIARYNLYLSFTGGPTLRLLEQRYNSPMARALHCSVDPALYYPQPRPHKWDLGYLGTYSADRQPPLERFLLEPARRMPAARLIVAGPQYPADAQWPVNVERVIHLAPAHHSAFYNAQRFTLNITRADMLRAGWSPSVRLFEAAACGVPIISDWWEGLDSFLKPDSEVLVARSSEDVIAILGRMPDGQRHHIAQRARQAILARHTAAHRAAELEDHVREAMDRSARAQATPAAAASRKLEVG